jgi:hypothetical protein
MGAEVGAAIPRDLALFVSPWPHVPVAVAALLLLGHPYFSPFSVR